MEVLEATVRPPIAESREVHFQDLYESAFPAFARFVARMKGSLQDAKDIFHDAMVVYCERSLEPGFSITTSPQAYVLGTARNLWLKKFYRDRGRVSLEEAEEGFEVPDDYFPQGNERKLLAFLERSGKRCMDLLHKFYFENKSLKEIAASLKFRNEHSAAVQKFKCIAKVRDAIKAKSVRYEDFRN